MNDKLHLVQLGALLHDIDIIVRGAGLSKENDLHPGSAYLKGNGLFSQKDTEVCDIIDHSCEEELKKASLLEDSVAYLVYEANNIASGTGRRSAPKTGVKKELNSIFNLIRPEIPSAGKIFPPGDVKKDFNMPRKPGNNGSSSLYYAEKLEAITKVLKTDPAIEDLLVALEENASFLPSSAYPEHSDVSCYDHARIVTALASCMYLYDREQGITDWKKEYLDRTDARKTEKYLFVLGEFTGIQDFIYTITSKMAMKSLRGRSFYLELFTEHIIDEILSNLSLNRANLIYSGGSQFYLLLPNTSQAIRLLEDCHEKINDFLLEEFGTKLYFEMAWVPATAEDLGNGLDVELKTENKLGEVFRQSAIKTSKGKINRYCSPQLEDLFNEDSEINAVHSYTGECVICKKAEKDEILQSNKEAREKRTGGDDDPEGVEICDSCNGFIELGSVIAKLYGEDRGFLVETYKKDEETPKKPKGALIELPLLKGGRVYLRLMDEDKVKNLDRNGELHRYYSVNSIHTGDLLCKNISVGNYNVPNEGKGLVEFKELVKMSKGIRRLAVLRADVDNLGTLFQSGFEDKNSKQSFRHVTLSKSAVLSGYLSDFFKRRINLILERRDGASAHNEIFKEYCNLISSSEKKFRDIVVVYSGGDDLFVIGTWNDVLEFAVDLRTAFREFTNGKITLSAGIGFFGESFPVYQMAGRTGELEKLAKEYTKGNSPLPTKDAIALFGRMSDERLNHVYVWDEFIDKVLYEKYDYLKQNVDFKEDSGSKLFVGKSKWYKLMDLIIQRLTVGNRIDIARFAYTIARIRHTKDNEQTYQDFKKTMLIWMRNEEDAKQLLTAINLIIYEEREGAKWADK